LYFLRGIKIAKKMIDVLQLDLSGKIVLTEVGSENYLFTPVIAALANAKKVYVWTRDSNYELGLFNKINCLNICYICGGGIENRLEFSVNERPDNNIREADIITNSGFLRPLDENFLKKTKPGCVIPLMFESWEARDYDIDIDFCKKNNIKVAGTWENYPDIKVFDAIGPLCVKVALNAGFEIFQNNIIVWSSDIYGDKAVSAFRHFGANSVIKTSDVNYVYKNFDNVDFLFICDYKEKKQFFGINAIFDVEKLKSINSSFGVVHLIGGVYHEILTINNISVYPKRFGYASRMSETLSYLGMSPIINLQVAGFKVGQNMIEGKESKLNEPITY
jgi:hypothetical protein